MNALCTYSCDVSDYTPNIYQSVFYHNKNNSIYNSVCNTSIDNSAISNAVELTVAGDSLFDTMFDSSKVIVNIQNTDDAVYDTVCESDYI